MVVRYSFLLAVLCAGWVPLSGQTAGPRTDTALPSPSAMLQPSLDVLKQALGDVAVDKWKASGAIKSEALSNVGSIRRDLDTTLPPLLAAADASPNSAAKVLPAYRNVEALYDVLLRVTIAGRLAAPATQSSELDQALARLDEGQRALGDGLQTYADAQEKRVGELQVALKTAQATPAPPPPAVVPAACPAPAVKKKPRPAVKPATPAAQSNTSSTPSQ